ncbi:MAG: galactose oxidase [Acidobacteria bacterium]|nr:galactose oxidase [Acidobacteriota bacterium]
MKPIFGVLVLIPALALAQGGPGWSLHASMPFERSETTAAVVNGKVYLISGNSRGNEANSLLQEYDPATGTWRERALMPSVASHAGAAALDGKIYVVGGFVANVHVGAVTRVFEYDPAADRWRALAPLSAPRGAPGVVALNGRVHAIGGRDPDRKTVATHEIYDPATNTWRMAAPLPLARDHLGIAVAGGRIHVFGGRTEATVDNTGRHDVYDPATDTWRTAAPLLTPRSAGAAFVLDGRLVYAGGECRDAKASITFTEVEAYDPGTDRWIALPALTPGRHAAAAAVVDTQAFVFGGNTGCGGNGPSKDVLVWRLR